MEEESEPKSFSADELREKGNQCVKKEKYAEAILFYGQAIKITPNDPILYSNRSLANLRLKQHYSANEDADRAIELKPDWAKGYFRKAEVLADAGEYDLSLLSYAQALHFQQKDDNIINAAKRVAALSSKQKRDNKRMPLFGAVFGLVLGIFIVIADQSFTNKPTIFHPILMVLLVSCVAAMCFGITKCYRYYVKQQRKGLLEPPLSLLDGVLKKKKSVNQDENSDIDLQNTTSGVNRTRYSKSQARQRFKKGKS